MTKDQIKSPLWREERRKRLTASNFGMVCTKKDQGSCKHVVFNILYNSVDNEFTRHGQAMEPAALRALREKFGVRGRRSGVFIDQQYPFLAATPDGLVGSDAIIEVKCPFRAGEFKTPFLAVRNGALPYCAASVNGSIWLKRRSLYHYQVQGQLHITRRLKCHFFIYTTQWLHHEIIYRDDHFWETKMVNKLKRFYYDCLLPEIVDPQYKLRNNTEDIRSGDFITKAMEKASKTKFPHDASERERIIRQFENIPLIMK